jgi:hypothetical protein
MGAPVETVRCAVVRPDGILSTWGQENAALLPKPLHAHSSATTGRRVYVVGGYSGAYERAIYTAIINEDGSLAAWQSVRGLPEGQERAAHAVTIAGDYLYVLGGYLYPNALDTVWRALIFPDGSLGTWEQDVSLPTPLFWLSVASHVGAVYVIGGQPASAGVSRRIYRSFVGADGSLSRWEDLGDLLLERRADSISMVDQGKLYVIGGTNGVAPQATVYVYEISAAGLIPLPPDRPLPRPRMRAAGAVSGNHAIYVLGGLDGTAQQNTVYMARVATPGLTLSLTSDRHGPLRWGDELEYRIGFQNGPAWLENVTITNTLPIISTGAITVTGISFGGRQEGDQVRWPPWPVLAPGWTAELTYTVRLSATAPALSTLCGDVVLVNQGAHAAWTYSGQPATSRSEPFIHGCTLYAPLIWP